MTLSERLVRFGDAWGELPPELQAFGEVAALYAQVTREGVDGSAWRVLGDRLRQMPEDDVRAFAAAVAATPGGEEILEALFGAELCLDEEGEAGPDFTRDPGETTDPAVDSGVASSAPADPNAYMDTYVKALEELLQTTGDDSQLANVDLQNALQTQQQMLQMLSNISKTLHDTALSIVRKIGS